MIGGGFAKLAKLGQGFMDLHSGRSRVDFNWLAERAEEAGIKTAADGIRAANTAQHAREIALQAGLDLAPVIARHARQQAIKILQGAPVQVDVMVVDKQGKIIAHEGHDD